MKAEFLREGTILTVKPEGRMDTMTAPELDEQIHEKMNNVTSLILDLENVEYVSSGGLRVILQLRQEMEDLGGNLKLRHVNEYIMEVFDLTGFLNILTIE